MIYLTSDTHFNHANIIGYCNRPWATVDDMNAGLVERWNSTVGPDDTVFHLGDFAMGLHDFAPAVFEQLNGEKHLIVGNHDSGKIKRMRWASVQKHHRELIGGKRLYMIHDPGRASVADVAPGTVVLHGHLHGMAQLHPFTKHPEGRYIDVGVDCWDYRPVALAHVLRPA